MLPAAPHTEEYLTTNPDQISVLGESEEPLLTTAEAGELLSVQMSVKERQILNKIRAENVSWGNDQTVFRWVIARGPDKAVRTLQNLQKTLYGKRRQLEVQQQNRIRRQHQQQQQQQLLLQQQQQNQNQQRAKGNTETPVSDSSQVYAWSSFQNSPDPKSLPIPRFSQQGQIPLAFNLEDDGERVNKFGVPPPPALPMAVKNDGLAAVAAWQKDQQATKKANPQQKKKVTSATKGPKKPHQLATRMPAPSPIRPKLTSNASQESS